MNDIFHRFLNNLLFATTTISKNKEDHERYVSLVLKKLCNAGLYTKSDKCFFHQPQVKLLGYIIFKKDLFMDPKKI